MEHNQSVKTMLEAIEKSERMVKTIMDSCVDMTIAKGDLSLDNVASIGAALSKTIAKLVCMCTGLPEGMNDSIAATPPIAVVTAPYIRKLLAMVEDKAAVNKKEDSSYAE